MVDSRRTVCLPSGTSPSRWCLQSVLLPAWPRMPRNSSGRADDSLPNARPMLLSPPFSARCDMRPDYAPAWKALGVVFASRGEFERAETPFRNACERQPSLPDACLYYGRTLYLLNRFQPAIDVLRPVHSKERENAKPTACSRSRSKRSARPPKPAMPSARLCASIAAPPPNEDPGIDYGVFLFRQGRAEDAVGAVGKRLEAASRRRPRTPGTGLHRTRAGSSATKPRRTWNAPSRSIAA